MGIANKWTCFFVKTYLLSSAAIEMWQLDSIKPCMHTMHMYFVLQVMQRHWWNAAVQAFKCIITICTKYIKMCIKNWVFNCSRIQVKLSNAKVNPKQAHSPVFQSLSVIQISFFFNIHTLKCMQVFFDSHWKVLLIAYRLAIPAFLTAVEMAFTAVQMEFSRLVSSPVPWAFLPSSRTNLVRVRTSVSKAPLSDISLSGVGPVPCVWSGIMWAGT